MHLWSASFAVAVVAVVVAWAAWGARLRFAGWSWWRPTAFVAGAAFAVGAVVSPLDVLGEDNLLIAHVAQHVILADFAAALLLLGLPPEAKSTMRRAFARLAAKRNRAARALTFALSPIGAFAAWALGTYIWFTPPLHRLAIPDGPVHLADHASFLVLGLVVWLAAFDPRTPQELRAGLTHGGLPWWARHVYVMVARLAMLPPAFVVWLAAPGAYHRAGGVPFGLSRAGDQERAASVMIGFEMLLFGLAVVLAFIFVSVYEGKERARHVPPGPSGGDRP